MRQTLESFLALVGLFVLAGTYFASTLQLFHDPYHIFWAAAGAILLLAWFCYSAWIERIGPEEQAKNSTLEVGVDVYTSKYRRSLPVRIVSSIALAIGCIAIFFLYRSESAGVFDLAYCSRAGFFHRSYGILDSAEKERLGIDSLPFFDTKKTGVESGVDHDVVSLVIAKRPRVQWLEVAAIEVRVEEYDPRIPKVQGFETVKRTVNSPTPTVFPIGFSVMLEPPSESQNSYRATIGDFHEVEMNRSALTVLQDDLPTPVEINVYSSRPGVYTYSVNIQFRNLWRTQTVEVCRGRTIVMREFVPTNAESGIDPSVEEFAPAQEFTPVAPRRRAPPPP